MDQSMLETDWLEQLLVMDSSQVDGMHWEQPDDRPSSKADPRRQQSASPSHSSDGTFLRTSCRDGGAQCSHEAMHGSHGAMLDPSAILLEGLDLPALDSLLQDAEQFHDHMDLSLWPDLDTGSDSVAAALVPSPAHSSGGAYGSPGASAAASGGPALARGEAAGSPPLSDSESGPGRGSTTGGVASRARSPDAAASQEHSSGSGGAADTRTSFRGSPGRSDSESLSHPGGVAPCLPGSAVRDGAESGHRMVSLPQMVPIGSGSLGPQQLPPLALSRQPSTATGSTGPPPAAGPAPVSHGASRGTKHARSEAAGKAPTAAAAAEREAAGQSSRPRKRPQNDELERRCQDLTVANTHLTGLVQRLTADNAALRHQLALVCRDAGRPLPPQFAPLPFPFPPAAAAGAPKIPIQKLKHAARPTPAPAPKKAPSAPDAESAEAGTAAAPAAEAPSAAKGRLSQKKYKARHVAGAGTAFLALFSLLVFSGPSGMVPFSGSGTGSLPQYAALPAADSGLLTRHGRVLTSFEPSEASHQAAVALVQDVLQEVERVVGWDPAEGGDGGGNLTGIPVLLRPNDKATERAALQRLKDLAPLALFSEDKSRAAVAPRLAGTGGWGTGALSAPLDYGTTARQMLNAAGFVEPVGCREVFHFDAASLRDPEAAEAQVQRYAATLAAFRGRIPRALPLPAIEDDTDDDPAPSSAFGRGRRSSTLGYGKASIGSEPGDTVEGGLNGVVVSILLPTKSGLVSGVSGAAAGGNDSSVPANFTTLDQIFVVVLKPRAQYATYSCALPSPVLV